MLVCDAARKPLMLFWLVLQRGVRGALVFTKSAESTTRLVRLFEFFEAAFHGSQGQGQGKPIVARAYSSDLAPAERKSILERFKNQEVGLFGLGTDWEKVRRINDEPIPSCDELRKLGLLH